ncbi:hypothetical protein MT996_10790 [Ornithobacterium rhinotracheale]|uniref:hypothetical protein n=1 Tax=Ornithobacterium rhinotracheale TaxID=28251 RepID=UPI00129C69F7|nr:hypothetical protein [Ornithobacterium rhinotracheale]UOH77679.1 hypothetical protein MT996_10790 [Ornithobacterium rhinotracheale]
MNCSKDTARLDLVFREGDTSPAWTINLLDGDGKSVDISGFQFYMETQDLNGNRQELRTIGRGLSIEHNNLIIEKKQRENLPDGIYSYALKMKKNNGDIITFLEGKLTIKKLIAHES